MLPNVDGYPFCPERILILIGSKCTGFFNPRFWAVISLARWNLITRTGNREFFVVRNCEPYFALRIDKKNPFERLHRYLFYRKEGFVLLLPGTLQDRQPQKLTCKKRQFGRVSYFIVLL